MEKNPPGALSLQTVSSPTKKWPWRCSSVSSSRPLSSSELQPARRPRSPAARPTPPAPRTTPCTRSERASPVSHRQRPQSERICGGSIRRRSHQPDLLTFDLLSSPSEGSVAMKDSIIPRIPRQHYCSYGQIPLPSPFSFLSQDTPLPSPSGAPSYMLHCDSGQLDGEHPPPV